MAQWQKPVPSVIHQRGPSQLCSVRCSHFNETTSAAEEGAVFSETVISHLKPSLTVWLRGQSPQKGCRQSQTPRLLLQERGNSPEPRMNALFMEECGVNF